MNATPSISSKVLAGFRKSVKSRKLRIIGIIVLFFFVLFSVTGFFILPPYVKKTAIAKLSERLGRQVSIEAVSLNPYSLEATIKGVEIKEADGHTPFVSFGILYANLQLKSLLKGAPAFKEIRLEKPYLHLVRTAANTYNFSDIMDRLKTAPEAAKEKSSKPFYFLVNNIRIADGRIDFDDQPVLTHHVIAQINLTVPFISDLPAYSESYVEPALNAVVNGTPMSFKGASKVFSDSRETSFNIALKNIDIPHYLPYAPAQLNVKVPSGKLDVAMKLAYRQYKDRAPLLLLTGETTLKDLAVAMKKDKDDFFKMPILSIKDISLDLDAYKIEIGSISTEKAQIEVAKSENGQINVLSLMSSPPVAQPAPKDDTPKTTSPWVLTLKSLVINSYTLTFSDRSTANPYGIKTLSGKLDVAMNVEYSQFKNRAPLLVLTGETRVSQFAASMKKDKDDFLKIPLLSVKDLSLDMDAHKVEIGTISTEKGRIAVARSADGRINLTSLMPGTTGAHPAAKEAARKTSPWILALKSLEISGYMVNVSDRSTSQPFSMSVDEITCKASNISTGANTKGTLALGMRVDRKGTASVNGHFTIEPLAADMSLNIKGLPLKPIQPYLAERTKAILASGSINVKGEVSAKQARKGELKTAFKGKLWVNKFALLDKTNAEELIKWDTLYMGEMDIRYAPLFLHINEISFTNPYSRINISANRTINLQEVFAGPETQKTPAKPSEFPAVKATPAAESPKEGPKTVQQRMIKIDKITLQGGTINLTDNSISPRFSGNMLELGGRISGLSSEENKFGEVELRGKYDQYAPLEITGKINPLRDDLYVELKADFKDMDLTQVSPYSGRYAGYTIQKGKLSFQLEYLIVKNKLEAKNNIFLDQFTLGDPVESPNATKLPVKLAVALLKNRNGEIKLDLPVSGDINDPKFSIGSVIVKIIVNLLVKAATSPFALLGAIFGGGEQLGYAEFDYGSAALTTDTIKKLDTLGKALDDRPALRMDITGHLDLEKDREGLKQYLLSRKVKTQKVKDLAKSGGETPSLDSVKVTDEEYPKYLKQAYKAEKFPKPRNFIGMAKDLPVPEMEKLMLTNTKVTDDDLKALAAERARAVRDYLVQSKKLDQERIFIVEAKMNEIEKKEGVKLSRAEFKLK
jgi:hypothetical protein